MNLNDPKRFENGSITQSQGFQGISSSYSCDFMYEVKLSLLKKIHGTHFRGKTCLIQYGLKKPKMAQACSKIGFPRNKPIIFSNFFDEIKGILMKRSNGANF